MSLTFHYPSQKEARQLVGAVKSCFPTFWPNILNFHSSLITPVIHPVLLIRMVWTTVMTHDFNIISLYHWFGGGGCLWFLRSQIKSSKHQPFSLCIFFLLFFPWLYLEMCCNCLSSFYLKCVCLGWRKVSCWDFNLLTEPSATVTGLHISGIKSEAVQHVRCSSCTHADPPPLWHTYLPSHNKNKWHILSSKYCTGKKGASMRILTVSLTV